MLEGFNEDGGGLADRRIGLFKESGDVVYTNEERNPR